MRGPTRAELAPVALGMGFSGRSEERLPLTLSVFSLKARHRALASSAFSSKSRWPSSEKHFDSTCLYSLHDA